jgi:hypothetical protein
MASRQYYAPAVPALIQPSSAATQEVEHNGPSKAALSLNNLMAQMKIMEAGQLAAVPFSKKDFTFDSSDSSHFAVSALTVIGLLFSFGSNLFIMLGWPRGVAIDLTTARILVGVSTFYPYFVYIVLAAYRSRDHVTQCLVEIEHFIVHLTPAAAFNVIYFSLLFALNADFSELEQSLFMFVMSAIIVKLSVMGVAQVLLRWTSTVANMFFSRLTTFFDAHTDALARKASGGDETGEYMVPRGRGGSKTSALSGTQGKHRSRFQ